MLNEQKDLILNNIKELIDNLLNLLKEKQKQKYKDILYSMLDYNISIQDIAKMKLEKYLKQTGMLQGGENIWWLLAF